eukprot:symbB.v1.2.030597.t1/scaffold3468.1/size57745/2
MSCGAPPPWAADPWRPEPSLADLAGAAVPFPTWRKAPTPGFLPAWQELQLRGLPAASPWPAAPASFQTPGFPVAPVATGTAPAPAAAPAAAPVAPVHGLIFPGELTNEKEKRRKQQQEMQSALAEQIKEQRAKKEQQKWLASASEAEATHLKYGTPRQGQNTTSFQPLHPQAQGEEDAERERKRLQQQELIGLLPRSYNELWLYRSKKRGRGRRKHGGLGPSEETCSQPANKVPNFLHFREATRRRGCERGGTAAKGDCSGTTWCKEAREAPRRLHSRRTGSAWRSAFRA